MRTKVAEAGSSPRIRGESNLGRCRWLYDGIIPANTGRICSVPFAASIDWDHPREYGENYVIHGVSRYRRGSSPRIRGEL